MTKKTETLAFPISSIVPEYWDLKVKTQDDVLFLGKITIQEMLSSWEYKEKGLAGGIKSLQEKINFLKGSMRILNFQRLGF
jgi:hypothetical protein